MIFLLIFFILFVWIKSLIGGTILHYEIYYTTFKVGESKIYLSKNELKAIAYTTGLGNFIYPYYAEWVTTVDVNGYPITSTIFSQDRFKKRQKKLYFHPKEQKIIVEKILPQPKKKVYSISFPVFDELSSFVYSWKLNYNSHKEYQLPLYIDGERHMANIKLIGNKTCKSLNKEELCLNLMVTLPEKSELLKRSNKVQIFLSEKDKIPLELIGTLPLFGSLKAYLKEISYF
mgnify:CR=1 FL=1